MSEPHKTFASLLLLLASLYFATLACSLPSADATPVPAPTEIPATTEARETEEAVAQATTFYEIDNYIIKPAERDQAITDPDERLRFVYEGENQSYHTGLRNRTVYYINYDTGVVVANESASFEEGAGELVRRGTDTISFSGWYHSATNTFKGKLNIATEGTAVGSGDRADWTNTVTYDMSGDVMMWNVGGEWSGHVEGTATLRQSWPSGRYEDEVTNYNIRWEITGVPVQE
jgi:hypothetical protein